MSFVTFSIDTVTDGGTSTFSGTAGEYRIAAKKTSETAPTSKEIIDSKTSIIRTLGPTPINIYLPYHIDGTLFGLDDASRNLSAVQATVLEPETQYSIYIIPAEGGEVTKLLDVTTDSRTDNTEYHGYPAGRDYSVRQDEPFILEFATKVYDNNFNLWNNNKISGSCSISSCLDYKPFTIYKNINVNPQPPIYYIYVVSNAIGYNFSPIIRGSKEIRTNINFVSTSITAPTGLVISNTTNDGFTVIWNKVEGAKHYKIYLVHPFLSTSGRFQIIYDNITLLTYTFTGLVNPTSNNNGNYDVTVFACDEKNCSFPSPTSSVPFTPNSITN